MSPRTGPDAAGRLLSSIGLAARAGRTRVGLDAVKQSVRSGEAAAVIIAGDAPKRMMRKIDQLLALAETPFRVVLDGDAIGRAIGRERVVVLAITERSLGRRAIELAKQLEG